MCGRYSSTRSPSDLAAEFDADEIVGELPGPDYNVAPTVEVPAVLERRAREAERATRRLTPLVWGLVPSWAKDAKIGSRLINARVETVAEKPAFRRAFAARRCLLPADGFYEWYTPSGGPLDAKGKPRKQPFFVHRLDGGLLVMAGIYEIWRDPTRDAADDNAWLRTCSVITTRATDAVGHLHERMPMIIRRECVDTWLDPGLTDPAAALELLAVTDADVLGAYAVSTAVNSVRNNNPSLVEPLPTENGPTQTGPTQNGPTETGVQAPLL